jgi:hypothetical protein
MLSLINFYIFALMNVRLLTKENYSTISNKKGFTWLLIIVLLVSNYLSFQTADSFFERNSNEVIEEVNVEQDMLNSGNRIVDWAKELLRFFRNPK